MTPAIPRIGRVANPAENGLRRILENAEVLDHATENLFKARTGGKRSQFRALPEAQKEEWRQRAIELATQYAADYVDDSADDDPDPGEERPHLEIVRMA